MLKFEDIQKSKNVADLLDDQELARIGNQVIDGYNIDDDSRAEWNDLVDKAMVIAKQTLEVKNTPFPKASNIKYPLITQASIDFAARIYPELIQNDRVVKTAVIGRDDTNRKAQRAQRVSKHMSYQLLCETTDWEISLDRLLHILPILGTVFKKTYYSTIEERPVSELCHPKKIVVNYNVQSLETARRITHELTFYLNDVIERIRSGLYRKVDIEKLCPPEDEDQDQYDPPLELLEQHCFLDLDEDGYKEPYIVIVHKQSGEVLRIAPRFKKVKKNKDGEIVRIEPEHFFTDFHFIRSPDGGFYSLGLGTLLYPLNKAINTILNQLVDAGTLNNSQSGFLGRGLRLKNGEFRLKLGEWKVLDAAAGTNLAQNIVPLPTKEPSPTLFQLLGLLIDVGKELISSNDLMQGKGQTQNVAATTILAMVEQGMKVFNSITKRIYTSLSKEFNKIFDLNARYLPDAKYKAVIDEPGSDVKRDYNKDDYDVKPVASPAMASDAQRLARAQAILSLPGIDPYEGHKYFLQALQISDSQINKLLPPKDPNAPPPPEVLKLLAEVDKIQAEAKAKITEASILSENQMMEAARINMQRDLQRAQAEESAARVVKMREDAANNRRKVDLAYGKADQEAILAELKQAHQEEKDEMEVAVNAEKNQIKAAEVMMKHHEEREERDE
jgi:chaperonin GroES